MFRYASIPLGALCLRARSVQIQQTRGISRSPRSDDPDLEAEYSAARKWASGLNKYTIPRSLARVRYDRASGKGGQHINTTSSKATCTWPLDSVLAHVPEILHAELRSSRHYIPSSNSLQMSAQSSRSQRDNEEECYEKLFKFLCNVSKKAIPGETAPEQKRKVEQLQKTENAARIRMKKRHSAKKQARHGGGGGDY